MTYRDTSFSHQNIRLLNGILLKSLHEKIVYHSVLTVRPHNFDCIM